MKRTSLWGDGFEIKSKDSSREIIDKLNNPIGVQIVKKVLSSKKTSTEDKLQLIRIEVHRILGRYEENTLVIKTREELSNYIDKAISNGVIAIDTETNNSRDTLTCKLMGGCIYTPGEKQAYIPINHVDPDTDTRLSWQLTEQDIKEEFDRLTNTKIIMHNCKFDYKVIKNTCNCKLKVYWDTLVGAKVLDENERAGLKEQYIQKIDPSVEKYSIEHLFNIRYAVVDPDIFALYAAADAMMTYRLYEYQMSILGRPENKRLLDLMLNIEMPVSEVATEMELVGVDIDKEYTKRLSKKYNKQLCDIDDKIAKELKKYDSVVAKWRTTKDANNITKDGGKSKSQQLENPINLASPVQLAILLYDVLKIPVVDKKTPRGTGEEILKEIDLPLCKLILERRGLLKLINTYIDSILDICEKSPDGRVHTHFNQYGASTGRFSSSDPINLQNIPSHNKEIRMIFRASDGYSFVGGDYSL